MSQRCDTRLRAEVASLLSGCARPSMRRVVRPFQGCPWRWERSFHLPRRDKLRQFEQEMLQSQSCGDREGGRALREMTRLGSSPYSTWCDVALSNPQHVERPCMLWSSGWPICARICGRQDCARSSSEPIGSVSRRVSASTVYSRRRKVASFKRACADGIGSHFRIVVKLERANTERLRLLVPAI
jgi:hypothetical protein